jgi:hypothetical protein
MKTIRSAFLAASIAWAAAAVAPAPPAAAQGAATTTVAAQWPQADPADVASVDAIIAALYDVISGPIGETRDWDRFRSLFAPQGRLIPTGRAQDGSIRHNVMSPDDYVASSGPFLEERGFFEVESARVTERFGDIAHAFSTYESRWTPDDPVPFQKGINSIQLLHDGTRWRILNIFWAGERPDMSIPPKYLPGGAGR